MSRQSQTPSKGKRNSLSYNEIAMIRSTPKSNSRIAPDSCNIGGRVMLMQERIGHQKRLANIQSTLNLKEPWRFDRHSDTPPKGPPRPSSHPSKVKGKRPPNTSQGQRSPKKPRAQTSHRKLSIRPIAKATSTELEGTLLKNRRRSTKSEAPLSEFISEANGIDSFLEMNEEDRDIYEKFVNMLSKVENPIHAKKITQSALREAEERQILQNYIEISTYFDDALSTVPVDVKESPYFYNIENTDETDDWIHDESGIYESQTQEETDVFGNPTESVAFENPISINTEEIISESL